MSIAALKRKTMNGNPRMSPISGSNNGPLGFALNGTRRNSGVVGNTNLASDGPNNMQCCTNNPNIIKRSVMNTKGMLSSRYDNCTNKCPPKPVFQETVKDQDEHIKKLSVNCNLDDKITLRTHCGTTYTEEDQNIFICHNKCDHKHIGGKNVFKGAYTKNPPGAMSQSTYINGKYLKNNAYLLPTKNGKCTPHFPPRANNSACFTLYKTLNEMEAAKQI